MVKPIELLPAEVQAFLKELATVRQQVNTPVAATEEILPSQVRLAMLEGSPLIEWIKIDVDTDNFLKTVREIIALTARHRSQLSEQLELAWKVIEGADPKDLVDRSAWRDEAYFRSLAIDGKVDQALLMFICEQALRPFLKAYGAAYSPQLKIELWEKGYCPVCGEQPSFAQIAGEDRGKELWCERCHSQWRVPLLQCAHCDNKEHQRIGYFEVKEFPGIRIEYCNQCKGYVKTLSGKSLDGFNFEYEAMACLPLDIIAEKEGYVNKGVKYSLN